ncbi:MAG: translation elongation factor Ts [SAR202 cluster bacterium]|nr:translation elongation factor Ts [SAR202 cluster bacterium]|tara:strand:+ start:21742 stop:22245 length:504 start_codon:yes stop_codon:yes gene_type:complete
MKISATIIKELRDKTSAGIIDCKEALEKTNGDLIKAEEFLKSKGIATAAKKASRETNEGLIESYIHNGGKVGSIIEISCETDFVARTEDFKSLAHDLAMQVAAMNPKVIEISESIQNDDIIENEDVLLNQAFIKDPEISINDLIQQTIAKVGENIKVRRFMRFSLGD